MKYITAFGVTKGKEHGVLKKKGLSFQKFMFGLCMGCGVFVCSLFAFAMNDSDAYQLLLSDVKNSFGTKYGDFVENGGSGSVEEEEGYSYEYVTTSGLNLDLIDRIPEVATGKIGYIKELLSIYRDAQNGKIVDGVELQLATLLGMHVNEISMVNSGGDLLPRYYFKPEDWKKETPNYCLWDYTSKSYKAGVTNGNVSEAGGYGIFQHLHTYAGTKSGVEPLSVKRDTSSGDVRFLPDMIATSAELYREFLKSCCPAKYLSDSEKGICIGICNNRGGAGCAAYLMGMHEYRDFFRYCNKMSKKAVKNSVTVWNDLFQEYFNQNIDSMDADIVSNFDTGESRCAAILIAAHAKDWYIDQFCFNTTNGAWNSMLSVYKALYPKEYQEDKNGAKLKETLKGMIAASVKESIKRTTNDSSVTDEDCAKVYGTKDYQGGSRMRSDFGGSLWHVSKERDDGVYKNSYASGKKPYYITSVDRTNAGYFFNCSGITGKYVYARLLKIAGVNSVDPTNPSTYSGTVTSIVKTRIETSTPTQTTTNGTYVGELDDYYAKNGVKLSNLSKNRIAVLNVAAEIAASPNWIYGFGMSRWGTCNNGRVGWRTDCSGYVYSVYQYAGFENAPRTNTTGIANSPMWNTVKFKELKPGDILNSSGHHVVIYLEGNSINSVTDVEAICDKSGSWIPSKEEEIAIYHNKDRNGYVPKRFKSIENEDYKLKPKKVPHKENDKDTITPAY